MIRTLSSKWDDGSLFDMMMTFHSIWWWHSLRKDKDFSPSVYYQKDSHFSYHKRKIICPVVISHLYAQSTKNDRTFSAMIVDIVMKVTRRKAIETLSSQKDSLLSKEIVLILIYKGISSIRTVQDVFSSGNHAFD